MQAEFYNALQSHGIPTPESSISESRFTRWGDNSRYWVKPVADGYLFGDFKQGISENWFPRFEKNLSHKEIIARQKQRDDEQKKAEAELLRLQEQTAVKAQAIWSNASTEGKSQYLERKQIKADRIRFKGNIIVIPLYDTTGKIWSLQYINENGDKRFLADGKKKGSFYLIGAEVQNLSLQKEVIVCEGFATGHSINQATDKIVAVAFDASNLEPVVSSIKKCYPQISLIIGADNDWFKEVNTGLVKAKEVAKKYNCSLVIPEFFDTIKKHNPSDFNDIHIHLGLEEVKRQVEAKVKENTKRIRALNISDFLKLQIPPREMLLSPILPSQGLAMLYAKRGIGKTQVSLSIALAIASGKEMFGGKWKCEKPCKVLFVDGEMPANVLQERLARLILNYGDFDPSYLNIVTPDMQEFGIPNLSEKEGQEAIEEYIQEDTKIIILDNLSTLCRSGKENDEDSWKPIQDWVLKLRSKGKSVLFIHHSNKSGTQRGTSKKEDILDTVITLKRPDDYENEQGARFEVHYEKARGFYGEDAKPFEAWLKEDNNQYSWSISEVEDNEQKKVVDLHNEKLSQRDIAIEMGISLSKVNRIIKKAKEGRLINQK